MTILPQRYKIPKEVIKRLDIPDNTLKQEYITSCYGAMKEKIYLSMEKTKREIKEFIHYSNKYEEKNYLEMKETIKSEIDEENINEYINGYLKSRNLKKEDLKRREHTK
jgi:hypothetical protein